jgi:large conductance mechanosensitive channel
MSGFTDFLFGTEFISIAIGVAIGTAFTTLITVLVSKLLTPFMSVLSGNVDISKLDIKWRNVIFSYGACIDAIITFIVVCLFIYFVIFLPYNKLKKRYV